MADVAKLTTQPLVAGLKPTGITPATFEDAFRMARVFSATSLVPKDYQGNPEAACVAILHGLEVGLSPAAALQSIAVINGRPSLFGDGMLAVVRASGLLEWITEEDDGTKAVCTVKRKGEPNPISRSFSDEDAKRAGLLGKSGPWTQYRPRMRQMRARSFCLRDVFADVLKGIASAEEMQDVPRAPMRDITPRHAAPLPGPAPEQLLNDTSDDVPVENGFDVDGLLDRLKTALDKCATSNELVAAWRPFDAEIEGPMPLDQRPRAYALYDEAEERIGANA